MTDNFTICAGTVGTGAWVSPDGGESWRQVRTGLWAESRVFGFAIHPKQPRTMLAGADDGIYRSEDGGEHFERLDSPMNAVHVWKVAFDPTDPQTIFAGTRPAALFRSTDGGAHWNKLPADMAEECPNVRIPRVTALTVDPADHRMVWAGVEVDGVRRSRDGGESWTRVAGVNDPDIHLPARMAARVGEGWGSASIFTCPIAAVWRSSPTNPVCCLSPPAMGRSAAPARSSARRMADKAGRRCRCPSNPIRRYGPLRPTRRTPTGSSPAVTMAKCSRARTPAIPGSNYAASSARSARWRGRQINPGDLRIRPDKGPPLRCHS
jgi:hypothetical protein